MPVTAQPDRSDNTSSLVAEARAGCSDAFGELFEVYQLRLLRNLMYLGADRPLAEDITQDSFLTAHQKLHQLRDDDRFWAWLYRIGCHLLFKTWRRKRLRQFVPLDCNDAGSEIRRAVAHDAPEIVNYPLRDSVKRILDGLSNHQLEALLLRYVAGYSARDAGAVLGITDSAAQRRGHRAKVAFRNRYTAFTSIQ